MSSSLKAKSDSHLRLVSDEDAMAFAEPARPTDDTPTVISKNPPLAESQNKLSDLSRKPTTPESIVAGLRGRKLAHFELLAPIGVGGMAAVIRARDTQLDRFVALKILPPEMAQESENVARFHQEAKAAAKLDHANIARVFFCGEDQGLHFIAFEFVEGMNLRTLMEQRGRLPVAESIRYVLQIAAGLEHAASRGVVHRDVKPSNIIITPHGQAKLVDMGLARNLDRTGERDLTQSGMTLGTFDYISPEQALEPREADSRSDIYSLGCTLYHMLTGQPPVPEGTPLKKLDYHQNHLPIDPRSLNPAVPDEVVAILGKMMAKNPKDRYQRPVQLLQHLMPVAQKVGAADVPEGGLFVDTPLPGKPMTHPLVMVGLALAALVALTLLFSFAPGPNTSGRPAVSPVEVNPQAVKGLGGDKPPPVRPPVDPGKAMQPVVSTVADLRDLFARPEATLKATLKDALNLQNAEIVYEGSAAQTVEVDSDDATHRPVKFEYTTTGAPIAMVLAGGRDVVFRRIHFQVTSAITPERAAAAVAIRGARTVRFEKCIFTQVVDKISPAEKRVPLASILIDPAEGVKPTVNLEECSFDNAGHVAIAINGAATVNLKDCALRPHGAFFSFRDKCTLEDTVVKLENCAGLVDMGPVFRFSRNASASIAAKQSVFSRPRQPGQVEGNLIYKVGDTPFLYQGTQNIYHNLNALLALDVGKAVDRIDDFQSYLSKNRLGYDVNSSAPGSSPSPWQLTDPLAASDDLAFQLKAPLHEKGFGLRKTWLRDMPAPVPSAPLAKAAGKKLVDPEAGDETPPGFSKVYQTIGAAVHEAKDGDTIFIKCGENRHIPVARADKPNVAITLKPYEGSRPILVFDNKEVQENEASQFVAKKSRLTFENLEFMVENPGFTSRSVVALGEGAHVVFDKCLFSLKATDKFELSVVSSIDLFGMMKMESPSPLLAKVEFKDCFVRGRGDLVSLQGCRKISVDMTNSFVVLDGSLLDLHATTKAMSAADVVQWKMERSSVFTNDSPFSLKAANGTKLTRTEVRIKDCLLAALSPERGIVLFDPVRDAGQNIVWDCEQNFYANFDPEKVREWREQISEIGSKDGRVMFKLTDEARRALWEVTPELLRPMDAAQERTLAPYGVPAEALERWLPVAPSPTDEP